MVRFYLDADVNADLGLLLAPRGHDVLTTYEVGRRRAGDEEQLAYAAMQGRMLITHNSRDFRLLQRAWRHWPDVWAMQQQPTHPGILVPLQPPHQTLGQTASAIDILVRSNRTFANRFYIWVGGRGWVQDG